MGRITACPPHPTPGMGLRSPAMAREVAEGQEMWGGSPGKEGRGQEAVTCCSAPWLAGCCLPAGFSAAPAPPSRAPSAAWCWPPRPTGGRWPRESTKFWGAPQKSHRHAENCPTLQTPRLCASHSAGRVPRMGCWCRAQHGTPPDPLPTFRMWLKSCLSTRKKWQLSSRRMMLAARGASFTSASCPKSSPSCRVATKPCGGTGMG